MSGKCIAKLPHSCGSSNGLQVFAKEDGTVDGYCFACGTKVDHPYGEEKRVEDIPKPKEKTQAEIDAELAEIDGYVTVDLPDRKLRKAALEFFDIKISLSEEDGKTPIARFYPYYKDGKIQAYKAKTVKGKYMWAVGKLKDVDLFGWDKAIKSASKKLIITTGEDDAVAVRRSLELNTKQAYKDQMPAVVSVVHGDGSAAKEILKHKAKIKQYFKEVVLAFDMDDSGQNAAKEVAKIMPEVTVAALPDKDANECIKNGSHKALFNSLIFNSKRVNNTSIIWGEDLHDAAREPAQWGELTWPWKGIQNLTRGIRYGETIFLGAGVKMGKSEVLNALASHFVKEHKIKILLAKPEESNKKTYKLMVGKMVGKVFHDPKVEFDYDAYDKAGEMLRGYISMLNLYQHITWEGLKAHIIEAVDAGVKVIFIDPITNLTNGMPAADANVELQKIAQELSAMALDYNIAVFIFCHLKAPEGNLAKDIRQAKYNKEIFVGLGNCPHELGGDVLSAQFAGSRAMMRSCNYMIGIEGNKDDELAEEIRNRRYLKLLEDREFGESGTIGIKWDRTTTLFEEF